MLKKSQKYILSLVCLMYSFTSFTQTYAPDTTFKIDFKLETGTKINFLHKIDDSSFYIGTNHSYDYNSFKPFLVNLYKCNVKGSVIDSIKNINTNLIGAFEGIIVFANRLGTQIYENGKIKFISSKIAFDVDWKNREILITETNKVKIINFEGVEVANPRLDAILGYFYIPVLFFRDNIISIETEKLDVLEKNGSKIQQGIKIILPKPLSPSIIPGLSYFNLWDNFIGLNTFSSSFPFYLNQLVFFDLSGKTVLDLSTNLYSNVLVADNNNLIVFTKKNNFEIAKYNFYDRNLQLINTKNFFGENYRTLISFDDYFIASDFNKIYKLSQKNSKYIEVQIPDTLTVNDKPIKIFAKTVGANEQVNISCNCGLIAGDSLSPTKSGNFIVIFKTNSGLIFNRNLTIKKRTDSIIYTGLRDAYLTEFPIKFSIKSKSGLEVKYILENNGWLDIRNNEIINRRIPSFSNSYKYLINLETKGNGEYESLKYSLKFEIKGIEKLINLRSVNDKFTIYPNPVNTNKFKVLFLGEEFISNPSFKLINSLGKELEITQTVDGNDYIYQLQITSNTPSGVYFLYITHYSFISGKVETEIRKVLIN